MKNNFKALFLLPVLAIVSTVFISSCGDDTPTPPDPEPSEYTIKDDGNGTGTTTWKEGKTYILDGFVFVNSGQTLTIEPGTIIKGKSGQGAEASALIVARGGKIIAEGTKDKPIIFTAEADDLKGSVDKGARGLWGGLIVLGNARLNTEPAEQQVEGIPTTEPRGVFGGNDDNDNSGVIKYVSIRHGGTDIGEGNEINGLTLGAVGSGTEIDYVEVISNNDDGIEFFGGTVGVKHAVLSLCGDDGFDYDMGFRGKGQFWVVLQAEDSNRCGEHDGGTNPETGTPYAIPTISNATYIGYANNEGNKLITFRDNAGGYYYNSIFANQYKGIDFEKLNSDQDSYKQFLDGNLKIENNVFFNITKANPDDLTGYIYAHGDGATDAMNAVLVDYFTNTGNIVADPGVSVDNPVPSNPQTGNMTSISDSWFENTSYKGAFDSENWAKGWTLTFE